MRALVAGPLFEPNGVVGGSFCLYESDDIETIRRFVLDDPFNTAGIAYRSVILRGQAKA